MTYFTNAIIIVLGCTYQKDMLYDGGFDKALIWLIVSQNFNLSFLEYVAFLDISKT